MSRAGLYKLRREYESTGSVVDRPRRTMTPKLGQEHYRFIDEAMASNDELTARRLREKLEDRWPGIAVSLSTVKRARRCLGWVATRPKYCQLIRDQNKENRCASEKITLLLDYSFVETCISGISSSLKSSLVSFMNKHVDHGLRLFVFWRASQPIKLYE